MEAKKQSISTEWRDSSSDQGEQGTERHGVAPCSASDPAQHLAHLQLFSPSVCRDDSALRRPRRMKEWYRVSATSLRLWMPSGSS